MTSEQNMKRQEIDAEIKKSLQALEHTRNYQRSLVNRLMLWGDDPFTTLVNEREEGLDRVKEDYIARAAEMSNATFLTRLFKFGFTSMDRWYDERCSEVAMASSRKFIMLSNLQNTVERVNDLILHMERRLQKLQHDLNDLN